MSLESNFEDYLIPLKALEQNISPESMEKGLPFENLQELLQLSDHVIKRYREVAYKLILEKRYDEAADAFFFLMNINPSIYNVWLGLAAAEQFRGSFEFAIYAYLILLQETPEEISIFLELAKCFAGLEELEVVKAILEKYGSSFEDSELKEDYHNLRHHLIEKGQKEA